ncbi:MAG: hypothetical protein M9894_35150 [Planctomycetes bacterium]|nr:hypothetical protein [Planctomycetota bacterium]
MGGWTHRLWSGAGPRARAATVIAALLGVGALALHPLAARWDPRLGVAVQALEPGSGGYTPVPGGGFKGEVEALDPWGRRLRCVIDPAGARTYYSVGPDGRDEDGGGDDVVPSERDLALARRLDGGALGLFSLAILLLWGAHGPFTRAPRSRSAGVEVGRALALASLPALVAPGVLAGLVLGRRDVTDAVDLLGRVLPTLVHPAVSALGGSVLLCTSLALAWRLSRPLEPT